MSTRTKTTADTILAYIIGSLIISAILVAVAIAIYEASKGNVNVHEGVI